MSNNDCLPDLFDVAGKKEALLLDCYRISEGGITWEIDFMRQPQDSELESVAAFCFAV